MHASLRGSYYTFRVHHNYRKHHDYILHMFGNMPSSCELLKLSRAHRNELATKEIIHETAVRGTHGMNCALGKAFVGCNLVPFVNAECGKKTFDTAQYRDGSGAILLVVLSPECFI